MENKEYVEIVIDTNFFLLPFQFKLDCFAILKAQIEGKVLFVISKSIVNELHGIKKKIPSKNARAASSALEYINKHKNYFKIIDDAQYADDWIYKYCIKHNCLCATNDKILKSRLKKKGIGVFVLKNKSLIEKV